MALIAMIVRGEMGGYGMDRSHTTEMYIVMGFLTVLAFWRHRANIVRLANGTENKVFLGKQRKVKGSVIWQKSVCWEPEAGEPHFPFF